MKKLDPITPDQTEFYLAMERGAQLKKEHRARFSFLCGDLGIEKDGFEELWTLCESMVTEVLLLTSTVQLDALQHLADKAGFEIVP